MKTGQREEQADDRAETRSRWRGVCERVGFSGDAHVLCEQLRVRYAEPWRVYHNLEHIEDCLAVFSEAAPHAPSLDIEVAILFHDAVYAVGAADNELRSAEFARELLLQIGANAGFIDDVVRLVLATDHRRALLDDRERLICDVDLSILGRAPANYDRYAAAIFREVGLSEREFAPHRLAFLRMMLGKAHIFHTEDFRQRYEQAARANLAREVRDWEARIGGSLGSTR